MASKQSRSEERGTGRGLLVVALVFVALAVGVLALAMTGRLRPLVEEAFPGLAGETAQTSGQQAQDQGENTATTLEPKEFCALARKLHEVNVDLIFARGWVNAAGAMDHDFVSILWTET